MKIEIKAKHFLDADFLDTHDCPLARAVRQATGIDDARVDVSTTVIRGDCYSLSNSFECWKYEECKSLATLLTDPETVLFTTEILDYES